MNLRGRPENQWIFHDRFQIGKACAGGFARHSFRHGKVLLIVLG